MRWVRSRSSSDRCNLLILNDMNILVAGGAGFIGTNFIQYWHKKYPKDTLFVLDNFSLTNREKYEQYVHGARVQLLEYDARNLAELQKVFDEVHPDCVINLIDGTKTPDYLQVNFFATANLLQASKTADISHFIHISPANVYGMLTNKHVSPHRFIHEKDAMIPYSPQQVSKAAADMLATSFWEAYNLPVTVLRLDYAYGPYESIDRLLPLMITNAILNRPMPVHVAASSERHLLHVSDVISAIESVLQSNVSKGKAYNVSAGVHATIIELAESVLTMLGRPKTLIDIDQDAEVRQTGTLDTTLITKELKWEPKGSKDLHKRLEETIQWYKDNQEWWGGNQ